MSEDFQSIRWGLNKYVIKLTSENGFLYAGYPRFMELFGRDSIISAIELFYIHPDILKNTLMVLAGNQGRIYNTGTGEEPGKILHELAGPEAFRYNPSKEKWVKPSVPLYYSIDSTPLFVLACELYIEKTNDAGFLDYIRKHMERAVSWMIEKSGKTGFLTYNTGENGDKLATQGWLDGAWSVYGKRHGDTALIEVQGYFYQSMKQYNELFPENPLKSAIEKRINFLEGNINRYFWLEDEKYYSPAVFFTENGMEKINTITSSAGHLLLTGLIDGSRKTAIVKRLFENDISTPFGIRTVSSLSDYFDPYKYQAGSIWPHDNWLILQGLKHNGFKKEAKVLRDYILNAIETIREPYEYYSVDLNNNMINMDQLEIPPCMPQAWSTGAFMDILDDKF